MKCQIKFVDQIFIRRAVASTKIYIYIYSRLERQSLPLQLKRASQNEQNRKFWLRNVVKCGKYSTVKFALYSIMPWIANFLAHKNSIQNSQILQGYICHNVLLYCRKIYQIALSLKRNWYWFCNSVFIHFQRHTVIILEIFWLLILILHAWWSYISRTSLDKHVTSITSGVIKFFILKVRLLLELNIFLVSYG